MDDQGPGEGEESTSITSIESATMTQELPKVKEPARYHVLLHNDDYTPMEFVVQILQEFFDKSKEQATRIMFDVHNKGVGVCGSYTHEIAETKVAQIVKSARDSDYPLKCTMEEDKDEN